MKKEKIDKLEAKLIKYDVLIQSLDASVANTDLMKNNSNNDDFITDASNRLRIMKQEISKIRAKRDKIKHKLNKVKGTNYL